MKTIEERAKEWMDWLMLNSHIRESDLRDKVKGSLTELAADLNAEKEKEVAELRAANQRIANESIANQLALQAVCDRKHDALVNARGWILANAKTPIHALMEYTNLIISEKYDTSLLDEVKRVLAMAENSALSWDMLGRAKGNIAVQIWREDALKLLTRLGDSHE